MVRGTCSIAGRVGGRVEVRVRVRVRVRVKVRRESISINRPMLHLDTTNAHESHHYWA